MIQYKEIIKNVGIIIITACAAFVCTIFLNYQIDLSLAESLFIGDLKQLYDSMILQGYLIVLITGSCLVATSIVLLFFYIKHYIEEHSPDLGILKALGYPQSKMAFQFSSFGCSTFIGCTIGFIIGFLFIPTFYDSFRNADIISPIIPLHYHYILFVFIVGVPTLFFSLLSVGYSYHKLKRPSLELLKGITYESRKHKKYKDDMSLSFLNTLKKSIIKEKLSLAFFILFGSFCFSSMLQMSASMSDLASELMGIVMLIIGIVLASTTLFLAITTVLKYNQKTLAMMKVMGYSFRECRKSVLDGYRPLAYIGFVVGTIYQYILLKTMVEVVFKNVSESLTYSFDIPIFFVTLIGFILIYECIILVYTKKIEKLTIKTIMLEN